MHKLFPEKDYPFLSGGGEMGSLTREKDWTQTPLGHPSGWPQSLRTTLSILLNSRFPMFLWWGKDLIQFYNDAYHPSLGIEGKHPRALGQKGKDCWPEIWPVIQPLIDQVLNTGEATWNEDQFIPIYRNGKLDDVYWTFSYSPVMDETGAINGVLVVCNETTEKVKAVKKIADDSHQLQFTIDSAELGTWDLNPETNRFVGNDRLKKWFGLQPQDEIDLKDALDAIIPGDVEKVTDAISEALRPSSGGNYELEYSIKKTGTSEVRTVLAKGKALFNEEGIPYKFSGILQDVNERRNIELALRRSDEKFRNIVSQAPIGIVILQGKDFIVEMANETYLQIVDRKKENFIGRSLFYSMPEVKDKVGSLLTQILLTGEPYYGIEFEVPLHRHGKKETTYFNFVYHPLKDSDNSISGIIVIATEVTGQVRAKQELQESEKQFRDLVTQSPVAMAIFRGKELIVELANNTLLRNIWRRTLEEVQGKPLLEIFPELKGQEFPILMNEVLETGTPHKANEALALVNGPGGMRNFYLDYEYAPLFDADKKISGIMVTVNDVTEKVETRQQIKDAADRLLLATEGTQLATWDLNLLTYEVIHSPRLAVIFGHDPSTRLTHAAMRKIIHPGDRIALVEPAFEKAFKTGNYSYEARILPVDGPIRWIRTSGKVIFDENQQPVRMLGTLADITQQKNAEEQSARLASIVRHSDDAIISKLLDGTVTSWNGAAERIFGYKAEDIIGKSITVLVPPHKLDEEALIVEQLRQGNLIHHFETQRVTKDGQLLDISLTTSPVKNSQGEVIGASKIARDISRQKQSERLIAENNEQLNIVLNASDLGTWEINLQTGEINYSSRYLEIVGLDKNARPTHEELLATLHPEDRAIRDEAFKKGLETGLMHYSTRINWKDGSIHWVEATGKLFYDEKEQPLKFIGTLRDLTAQKQYQQMIEESESRLRIAALSSELGTWDYTPATGVMIWDNASRDLFGVPPEEMITTELFFSRIHPDDMPVALEKMQRALDPAIAENYDAEYRIVGLPGNKLRWVHAKGKAQFTEEKTAYRFSGTVLDITEKKLALEELERNEQRYRFLANSMPQFVWTGGPDGILSYFNDAVFEYTGLTPEEMSAGGWLSVIHPDDRQENIRKWMHCVNTGEPFLFEHRFRRKDGIYRWQLSRATAQKDEDDRITMWVGTSTDIDEIKKHEQQKNDFIKMANHELKTPVTTIKGYVQLLMKTHANSEDALATVDKQVTKLTNLVSDLLDVTKIERGSLPLNKESFLLNDLIKDTIMDMEAASKSHRIIFERDLKVPVNADRERISQVLLNLFTNAFKYSPKADEVLVRLEKDENNMAVVSIKDYGIGIAEEDQGKIFERFYRVSGKDEKTFPGFGIGLFIVNEIMSLHEGKLWVKSEKDKGSTFYFSLPIQSK
ncbi:PAS domain S-box protein [Ferruginibacter sp. HRS2-29]|uniref:PAS domain S-box protein n=1 Tax=Ferruginibacter sp. HRS2-29 TaxID=2487334 RepID=UPI0020CC1116|nr:PAS domain S-box protein [Ferruginibacter sp. HRS2-29]MCP9753427.1 PAS domain S-box protein [Ferruginibacter sp. HRS2-29]